MNNTLNTLATLAVAAVVFYVLISFFVALFPVFAVLFILAVAALIGLRIYATIRMKRTARATDEFGSRRARATVVEISDAGNGEKLP